MVKNKRFLTLLLAIVMVLQTMVIPAFAAMTSDYIDFPYNSWSTEAMTAAVENGLITGTSDIRIEPNKNLTRAEFAAIITRAFGATEKADIAKLSDVKSSDWFYESVAKAVQMGTMNGTGETTFSPNADMKREDVILAMARVLFVDGNDASVLNQFSDRDEIDSWAVKAIAGMVNEGYINGYEDGTIRPQRLITRAELAQMFHNIFKTYISSEGTYENVASNGSVIVRAKDVTLKNVTINGDLVMADGIGDGDFHFENVTVKGKILARGGEGTVYFVDVKSDGEVIINDPNGTVNFHNYRDEVPFVNNLLENTPATFLERTKPIVPSGPSGAGGISPKYDLKFYDKDGTEVESVLNKKGNYVIKAEDVADIPANDAANIVKYGYNFEGWSKNDGVDVLQRSDFADKKMSVVKGDWKPYYTPKDFSISFMESDDTTAKVVAAGNKLFDGDATQIPTANTVPEKEFKGWTTVEGEATVEFTNEQLVADVVENVFVNGLTVTLYPVYEDVVTPPTAANYTTEYYFENDLGVYVIDDDYTDVQVGTIGAVVNAVVITVPGYEEDTEYADRVASATVLADGTTTLKLYYKKTVTPPTTANYTTEYYFENDLGVYVIDDDYTDVQVGTIGDVVNAIVITVPGYEEDTEHADRVASATVLADGTTTLKLYYKKTVTLEQYTITFYAEDGTAFSPSLTKLETESIVSSEIPVITPALATQKFVGWTTTQGSTTVEYVNADLIAGTVASVFGAATTVNLYPVIVDNDTVAYKTEYYFEQLDGTYVIDDTFTVTEYAIAGTNVTAQALDTIPEGFEETDHADEVESAVVTAPDNSTVLKLYYARKLLTVEYYDLGSVALSYEVKYGGTIDNFVDPADTAKTSGEIKQEIADYIEYLVYFGYGKDYDDKYIYSKFEEKDTNGDGIVNEDDYFFEMGVNGKYEHELNYNWYVKNSDSPFGYDIFDESHVFKNDLDLYAKHKQMRIAVRLPKNFAGIEIPAAAREISLLTPYEDTTRYIDHVRDTLFMNGDMINKIEMIEPKLYEKLENFELRGSNFINEDRELVETDLLFYFYEIMGGKDAFEKWLWDNVEDGIVDSMDQPVVINRYWEFRNTQPDDKTALRKVFEENALELPNGSLAQEAIDKYEASKKFVYEATETDYMTVTAQNDFIMEEVYNKIDSLRSFDAMLDEYAGGRIPEGLMNRLPMDVVREVYEPRIGRFLNELTAARAAGTGVVDSGIRFDVNTGEEIIKPLFAWMNDTYDTSVDKIVNSGNRVAELAEKYFADNPYATGIEDGYLEFNKFFADEDGDGFYNVKSFAELYEDVIKPLSVETADATLWYMDNVEFSKVRAVLQDPENERYILAVAGHINRMMKGYAENGLPETMSDYYYDLISNATVKEALEKIDNGVPFEMMNFVETQVQNATLQVLFAKVLERAGVPAEAVLVKYTSSGMYNTYSPSEYANYLDTLGLIWEKSEDGIVDYKITTDVMFEKLNPKFESVNEHKFTITFGEISVDVERSLVDTLGE